jgi:hypothetical protein
MMKIYRGSCHCQSVQFKFEAEEIKSALQCNCSICIRKNAIMSDFYLAPENFTMLTDVSELSVYLWGDEDVNHYFCKRCGVSPFHDVTYDPGKYRVNLGCVESINPRALKINQFDGKHLL